jgi:AraC-like DNA-binding protein
MAKSKMHDDRLRLLTADAATLKHPARTGRHHHAFWQLDHCAGGTIAAHITGHDLHLRPGEGLLLPPAAVHEFIYRRNSHYVSWKFTWDGAGPATPVVLAQQTGWTGVAAALAASSVIRPLHSATEHLLCAAMHIAGAPKPAAGFATDLSRIVDAHPARAWTVAGIAAALGLSPGHASARFRAESGMALKTWLDARRAAHAGEVMGASDLGLADLALRLGFADQFAFSRFFRRVTGDAPSVFRARQAAAEP